MRQHSRIGVFRRAFGVLAVAAGVIACGGPAGQPEEAATVAETYQVPPPVDYGELTIDLQPCTLRGLEEEAWCADYSVAEDSSRSDGRRISLRVVVLRALGEEPASEAVMIVPGGPGQGITAGTFLFERLLHNLRDRRDIVLFDARGSGASSPLTCILPGDNDDPQSYLGDLLPVPTIESCLAGLDADVTQYAAPQVIQDMDELRAALGYQHLDLFANSYGSRLALAYMRRYPGRVRSAVLNGVVPLDLGVPQHHAPDAQRALDLLFDACAEDPACQEAFPELRERFWTVHRRLAEEGPIAVTIDDQVTGRQLELTLNLDLFNEEIRWRLYDEESNLVPILVDEAYNGDYTGIVELLLRLRRAVATGRILSVGAFLSATCTEDTPFIDPAEAERLAEGTFLGLYRVAQQQAACSVWPRGTLPAGFRQPVTSDVPTLLISGFRDPVTPPKWGEAVLAGLANGRHVVFRQGFHTGGSPCSSAIVEQFIAAGSADGIDVSCADAMTPTPFVLSRQRDQPLEQ